MASASRKITYFIHGAGIDGEVITNDICKYLGQDARVHPGVHSDANGQTYEGYYITAYRTLTQAQLKDLRDDSSMWREEKRQTSSATSSYQGFENVEIVGRLRQEDWEMSPSDSVDTPMVDA